MIYLAIVSLIWAFSFGLIGKYLAGVDSYLIATIRLGLVLLVALPFIRIKGLKRSDQTMLMICGAIQFGLMYVCYIKVFQYLPSHLVALFSILTPVYVVLIHDIKNRKWTPHYFIPALLSVGGTAVIRANNDFSGNIWLGFGLMQAAGIAFAFGQVTYRDWKRAHPKVKDREVFGLLAAGGTITALVFALLLSDWSKLPTTAAHWSTLLYLGCIASGLGFFLWNKGASLTSPGTLGAFNNVVVPVGIAVSLFIFGEIKGASPEELTRLVIGSVLIGAALFIGQHKSQKS
ncbi:MAG: EamA family transporter [Coraliomargarita sp.]